MAEKFIAVGGLVAGIGLLSVGSGWQDAIGTVVVVLAVFSLLGIARTSTNSDRPPPPAGRWSVVATTAPNSPIDLVKAVREHVDVKASGLLRELADPPVEVARFATRAEAESLAARMAGFDVATKITEVGGAAD